MVTLLLDRTQLEVVLTPFERGVSFHRDNVRIDREAIAKVQLTDDPSTWLRGVPSPGTQLPGVLSAGSWKSASGLDFVLIRNRRPGVVIDVEGDDEPFRRLILTTRHGLALTQALHLEVSAEPADVSDIVAGETGETASRRRPVIRPRPA